MFSKLRANFMFFHTVNGHKVQPHHDHGIFHKLVTKLSSILTKNPIRKGKRRRRLNERKKGFISQRKNLRILPLSKKLREINAFTHY